MIKRSIEYEFELTPRELAHCFCEMSAQEQAGFFNEMAEIINGWAMPFAFQLEKVSQCDLSREARYNMSVIGEYSRVYRGE